MKSKDFYELTARFDSRQSFYGKAHVEVLNNGDKLLYSYATLVASIENEEKHCNGTYSQTTTRHIKEFFRQEMGDILSTKQLKELPAVSK